MSTLLGSIVSNFHLPARRANPSRPDLAGRARQVIAAVLERSQRRRELRQLLAMDDRALKDIGLTRVDALQFARGSGWRVVRKAAPAAAPPRITAELIDHYARRAHELRGRTVRNLARRLVARVRGWGITADRNLGDLS